MQETDYLSLSGRSLKLFLAVYDTGSVSQAANLFNLNQSTVSHGIDKLRARLGDPLFIKSGRGITPTERAAMLAPKVREILAGLESIATIGDYEPGRDKRPIVIAANTSFHLQFFAPLRDEFMLAAPNAPLRFLDLDSVSNIENTLIGGKADLLITVRPMRYPGVVNFIELAKSGYSCVYDPSVRGPITSVEDFCQAKHAVVDFGSDRKSLVDIALDKLHVSRNKMLSVSSLANLPAFMKGTEFITTMPTYSTRVLFEDFASCPPPVTLDDLHIDLVWHKKDEQSGRNSWLRRKVLDAVGHG